MADIAPSLASPPWELANQEGGPPPSISSVPVLSYEDPNSYGISARVTPSDPIAANTRYLVQVNCVEYGSGAVSVDLCQSSNNYLINALGLHEFEIETGANVVQQLINLVSHDANGIKLTKPKIAEIF